MTMRITGLSTGLYYDSIITDTLKPYKLKIQAQEQQKKILEWKQEQYQSIMKKSTAFYNKYLDILSKDSLTSTKNYNQTKFTSANENVVTVSSSSSATITNYSVTVTQLATKASGKISNTDLKSKADDEKGKTYEVSTDFGGQIITFNAEIGNSEANINTFKNAVNNKIIELADSKDGKSEDEQKNIDKQIETLNKAMEEAEKNNNSKLKSTLNNITVDTNTNLNVSDNTGSVDFKLSVKLSGDVDTTKALSNFNSKSNNITAKYSSISQGIVFESKNTGENTITINGVAATDTKGNNLKGEIWEGNDKKVLDESSNVVSVDGVTFTFKGKSSEKVEITGSQDVSELKDKIIDFMNDYNELIGEINGKLWESRDSDYLPLTDDQREAMSDKQIEQWETKAQAGLLRKDDDLNNLAESMKSIMSSLMSSTGLSLERIGITPVNDYKEKNGTFEIDEDKLTEALQKNFEGIKDLFTRNNLNGNTNENGLMFKMKDLFNDNFIKFDSVFNKKAATDGVYALTNEMTKQLTEKKNIIAEMNEILKDKEDALYVKYSALETAMAKAQSQQSSMSSWFGTGN